MKKTTSSNVRQTAMHEAASFVQRNCDVIQNGAEKINGRPIEQKKTGQLSLACTGHLRDHRYPGD